MRRHAKLRTSLRNGMSAAQPVAKKIVLIEKVVLERISKCVMNYGSTSEVGGILLGFRRGQYIHVTKATTPGHRDKRYELAFLRRDFSHQARATMEWIRSGFTVDWVGEWHSHLEDLPSPSSVDLRTWRKQVQSTKHPMTYIIVGNKDWWVGVLNNFGETAVPLVEIESSDQRMLFGPKPT